MAVRWPYSAKVRIIAGSLNKCMTDTVWSEENYVSLHRSANDDLYETENRTILPYNSILVAGIAVRTVLYLQIRDYVSPGVCVIVYQ